MAIHAPDLTQRPPRSPRVRLGGYVILPRMLDKGRAVIANKNGEYCYACPLDLRFAAFAGIDPEALKQELQNGKTDSEILEWVNANSKTKPAETDIAVWAQLEAQRSPADPETRQHFNELHSKAAAHRSDIATWFDLLDLDDFVTFGGQP